MTLSLRRIRIVPSCLTALLAMAFTLACAATLSAQILSNPRVAEFDPSADHWQMLESGESAVLRYELEVYLVGASAPFATVDLGKPSPDPDGKIRYDFASSVAGWPLPGGDYQACVRAVGPMGSALSEPSNTFNFSITPTIIWAAPAAIPYGTALSATQLNATASVAGALVYTPPAGTVLNAGLAQTLSVTFTPTDTTRYTTATKSVTIDVGKATPTITWVNPAAIVYGAALSATQLNAIASVAGAMVYTPAVGTVLNAGFAQTLSVTFTPTDTTRYTTATKTVTIEVTAASATNAGADFNGDGTPDVLWRNSVTGENYVWYMNGATRAGGAWLATVADLNWRSLETADFNGDAKPDIFWRNTATGENIIWYMNGATYVSYAWVDTVPIVWRLASVADFNGDGNPDLFWRNTTTGENIIWYLNGAAYVSYARVNTVPDLTWQIGGVADVNADGKPDLFWRNTTTGENIIWYLNNAAYVSYARVDTIADLNWKTAMVADFNGDGKPDVLWRNTTTGENIIWYLNNAAYVSYAWVLTVADLDWKIGQQQ